MAVIHRMFSIPAGRPISFVGHIFYGDPFTAAELEASKEITDGLIDLERLARSAHTADEATRLHCVAETIIARAGRISKAALDRSEAIQRAILSFEPKGAA